MKLPFVFRYSLYAELRGPAATVYLNGEYFVLQLNSKGDIVILSMAKNPS